MSVTDTSIEALAGHNDSGEAERVRELIIANLNESGRMTRAELSEAIKKPMHIISGRVGDFWEGTVCCGYTVVKSGKKVCSVGGKRVEALESRELTVDECVSIIHMLKQKYKCEAAKRQGLERAYKAVL